MRVAIAHDYLTQRGGAERVVLSMLRAFPEAPVYTTLFDPERTYPEFGRATVVTSALNRIAALRRYHRAALPFLPFAVRQHTIDADVLLASSSGWAHGYRCTGKKIVYCHAPARWLYQTGRYVGAGWPAMAKRAALAVLGRPLRRWDRRAARTADRYLANSEITRKRVESEYGIDAEVVFAPLTLPAADTDVPVNELADWVASGYFLVVSRLLPYKNVDVVVETFRRLRHRLVVVGSGPMRAAISAACPGNVRLVSDLSDAELCWVYRHAIAVIAPSFEDYGLTPLEAALYGRPTLALRAGGYLDTVVEGVTGLFVHEPTCEAVAEGVEAVLLRDWDPALIARHAEQFSEARFHDRLRAAVERVAGS